MRRMTVEEVENGYVITTLWSVGDGGCEETKEIATYFSEVIRAIVGWEYGIEVFYNEDKRQAVEEKILEMLRSVE